LPRGTRLVARGCTRLLRWAAAACMIPCWRPGGVAGCGGAWDVRFRLAYDAWACLHLRVRTVGLEHGMMIP
jgi:hypothetical protein